MGVDINDSTTFLSDIWLFQKNKYLPITGGTIPPENPDSVQFWIARSVLQCYSQILCGGSAKNFRFWLFCIDLVVN